MNPTPLIRHAPAKLNLDLRVGRADGRGYHPLVSWFRTFGASSDVLEVTPTDEASALDVTGPCAADAGPAGDNLVTRAWRAVVPADAPAARLALAKHIPAGGGLGGGSSDAAAALLLAADWGRLHGLRVPDDAARAAAAVRLGADVPFFLAHQRDGVTDATCTGYGEVVRPFAAARQHVALVLLTGIAVPTPAAYRAFDLLDRADDLEVPDYAAWSALPAAEVSALVRNDLEAAAFVVAPRLGVLRADVEQRLGRPVRMTGSGGTLFALFDGPAGARRAAGVASGSGVRCVIG